MSMIARYEQARSGPKAKTLSELVWPRITKRGSNDCWEWTAARDRKGYGQVKVRPEPGKAIQLKAHRAAWILTNGQIPEGRLVCHRCDNPPCCNPAHLFLGTHSDNMADMVSKKRALRQRITHCPRGHAYNASNTYLRNRKRYCRACTGIKAAGDAL